MKLTLHLYRRCAAAAMMILTLTGGCATHPAAPPPPPPVSDVFDQARQSSITSNEAVQRLIDGNHRFSSGSSLKRDYVAQMKSTADGQYPFAAVLSCMDSRTGPEIVFDQGIGDLFVVRIAGNIATPEVVGSLEYATKVAGAKLIVVMGHTQCGAIKGACDNVQMGNLTKVIDDLRPAVDDVQDVQGDRSSKNPDFVTAVALANVRRTVAHIKSSSPILSDLASSGNLRIIGAMQDVSTGAVTFYDWDQNPAILNSPTTTAPSP